MEKDQEYLGEGGLYAGVDPIDCPGLGVLKNLFDRYPVQLNGEYKNEFNEDPHVTVCYSKQDGDLAKIHRLLIQQKNRTYIATSKFLDYWPGHDNSGYIVLQLDSPNLTTLNSAFTETGCKHSFDEYSPHMTILKNFGDLVPSLKNWMIVLNKQLKQQPLTLSYGNLHINALND